MKTRDTLLTGAASVAVLLLGLTAASAEELHLYAWAEEVPQEVIDDFSKETGIEVTIDNFDSNESMVAKLEAGASGYDIIEPSQYAVQILIKKDLVQNLDHAKLPNLGNLGEVFQKISYDPGNKVSIPFIWGTTGFAYNSDCVKEPITSWKSLWDEKYKGRIYMLDNMLAAYIAGLQVNGFKASSTDADEIAKATESLLKQKPLLAGYNSTNFADLISSGEACIVEAWSGNVLKVTEENPKVHYVLPDEGGSMWIDGFALAKGAKNLDAAYKFLNYMLQPEVAAKVTKLTSTASAVAKSRDLLPPEIAKNQAVFPPEDKLAKADFILDPGEAMKHFQDGWTKVKATE